MYWTYEGPTGEWADAEFSTRADAIHWAENELAERLDGSGWRTYEANCKVIKFSWSDDGERIIHKIEPFVLGYEQEPAYG